MQNETSFDIVSQHKILYVVVKDITMRGQKLHYMYITKNI